MASKTKLNTSTPNKRTLFPPELLRERHDTIRKTRNTGERQRLDPSPMAKNFTNFRLDCDPPVEMPKRLYDSGRGKPAGSKRILKLPNPNKNDLDD